MEVAFWAYALIAAMAVMLTLNEGENRGRGWHIQRVLGVGLAVLWPLAILVVGATILYGRMEHHKKYHE